LPLVLVLADNSYNADCGVFLLRLWGDQLSPKVLPLVLAVSVVLIVFLVSPVSFEARSTSLKQTAVSQMNGLVHNLNTTLSYSGIQEAIDAAETLAGHVIRVDSGVYSERVSVSKAVSLLGEDRSSTVIDGSGGTVVLVLSDNVEVRDFTVRNGVFGIWVNHSDNVRIIGNVVFNGSYGIRLYLSRNAQVIGNRVSGFRFFGIDVDSSGNGFFRNNQMTGNKYNFGVDGNWLADFLNDIDESNTVNDQPIRYLINQHWLTIDSLTFESMGYLGLINSTNIKVEELEVQNNKQGVLFAFVANSSIASVTAVDNWNGVYVAHSKNVSVSWCKANYNYDYGIKFFNSSRSSATGNNVDNNGWAGIGLFKSPSSILDKNEANFNSYNLHIVYTNSSIITRNNASGLSPNKPSSYSIAVYYSHNNRIYHNSFSTTLLYIESRNGSRFTPANKWDNGYEGNYWLYYSGRDKEYDGLGDSAYSVGENNVDNFPLMGRFWDFIVLFEGRLYGITVISNSTVSHFEFVSGDARISLVVSGRNETQGFCRIAIPNALIQEVENASVEFVIGGVQPVLLRNWSDSSNHYWYFSYIHSVNPTPENHDFWPIVYALGISALLISVVLIVFVVSRRRRKTSKM